MATEADELPITIEDGCVVLQDTEYWVPAGATVGTVGALISFLELQDDFLGKKVIPYSAKRRKIVTKDVASSMVAYVKVEGGGGDSSQFLPTVDPDAAIRAEEEALAREEDELRRQEEDMRREQQRALAQAAKPKGMLKVMRSADDFAPKEEDSTARDRSMSSLLTDLQAPAIPAGKGASAVPWHQKALSVATGKPVAAPTPAPAPTSPTPKPAATAPTPVKPVAKPKAVALPPPPLVSSPKVELPPAQPKIAPPSAFPVPLSKQAAEPAKPAAQASTGSVLADAIRSRAQTAKAEKAAAKAAAAPGAAAAGSNSTYFPGLRKVAPPEKTSPFSKPKPAGEPEADPEPQPEPDPEPQPEEPVDDGQDALDSLDDLIVETKGSKIGAAPTPAPASPGKTKPGAATAVAAKPPAPVPATKAAARPQPTVPTPAAKKPAGKGDPTRFTMLLAQMAAGDEPPAETDGGDEAINELDDLLEEKTADIDAEEARLEEERRMLEEQEAALEAEEQERERERQEREEKERQRIIAEESARAKQMLIAKAKGIKPPEVKKPAAAVAVAAPTPTKPAPVAATPKSTTPPPVAAAKAVAKNSMRDSDTSVPAAKKAAATPPPKPYSSDTDIPKKAPVYKPPAPEEIQYTMSELEADPSICFTCERKIDESDPEIEEPLKACDRLWHKDCWLCYECKKSLFGEKFGSDGPRVYCEEDFKRKFFCATCGDFIEDEISEQNGKSYHPHCVPVERKSKPPEDEADYQKWMDEFRNRSVQKQAEQAAEPPVQVVAKPSAAPKMVTSKPPAHVLAAASPVAAAPASAPKPALIPIQPKPAGIAVASAVPQMSPRGETGNKSPRPMPKEPSTSNVLNASKPTNQAFKLDLSKSYTFTITNKVMVSLAAKGDPYGYQINIWDPSVLGGPSTIVRQYKDMETLYERLKPLNKRTPQLPKLSKKWKVAEELNELQTWLIAISRMEGVYRTEGMRAFMEGGDISVKAPMSANPGLSVGAPIAVRHVSHVTADDLRAAPKFPQ